MVYYFKQCSHKVVPLLYKLFGCVYCVQVHEVPCEKNNKPVCKSAAVSSYTLVTDSPGLPKFPGFRPEVAEPPSMLSSETPLTNGYREENDVKVENQERSEEDEEEDEDMSLDSLLKRSREYVQQEQKQQRSAEMVDLTRKTSSAETVSLKQQQRCSPIRDTGVEFGFNLHYSPVGPCPPQPQPLYDPSPQKSAPISPITPERYAHLPSPESSISPRPCRRKPRPVSTGNIPISFPIDPADLVPGSSGRLEDGAGRVDWSGSLSTGSICSWSVEGRDGNRRSSHCGTSPVQENKSPVSSSVPSSMTHPIHLSLGFRRRCHTLDSQLNTFQSGAERVDRSQERVPRFMAGLTWLAPSRCTPTGTLNQSYKVESPSPCLLRSSGSPDDSQWQNNSKKTPSFLKNTAQLKTKSGEFIY